MLPFQNLSADPAHAYFAVGLHDELLTQLSKVGALSLRGRSSVMGYAETRKPVRQIAEELRVGALVEGTVFYLQGPEYFRRPGLLRHNVEIAQALYERALARDPEFALARWLEQSLVFREDAYGGHVVALDRARILAQVGEVEAALEEIEPREALLPQRPHAPARPAVGSDPRAPAGSGRSCDATRRNSLASGAHQVGRTRSGSRRHAFRYLP